MKIRTFIQASGDATHTLSELSRIHLWADTHEFLGTYAYATMSGAAAFDLKFGDDFWTGVPTRWLVGIDYGRTQPRALRHLIAKPNVKVRVYDGDWVVAQAGFLPRRDFHAKTSFFFNQEQSRYGMVVGSGNFSSNGLRKSIEAAASLQATTTNEFERTIKRAADSANALWAEAVLATDILDDYEAIWTDAAERQTQTDDELPDIEVGAADIFWIEAGFVTLNRGPDRPGNQIDFPRGMSRYFGFNPPEDLDRNSVIGPITFVSPVGDEITRNLRLGNNLMEKISLPIPETHGFDIYDGKVLVFRRSGDAFIMHALETEDFEASFGDRLTAVRAMASGRRYGHIS